MMILDWFVNNWGFALAIIALLIMFFLLVKYSTNSHTTTISVGEQKTIRLGGHKATVKMTYIGWGANFIIKVCLRGGSVWEHTANLPNIYGHKVLFPQKTHGRRWRYRIMCQEFGEKKLRLTLERAKNS